MLETQNYTRNPFDVEAVRVTKRNMADVASWCGGEIQRAGKAQFVLVPVHKPANDRQTKAFIGDWVLFAGTGYKVYMPKAFAASFRKKDDAVNLRPTASDQPTDQIELVAVEYVKPTHPYLVPSAPLDTSLADEARARLHSAEVTVTRTSHPGDMPGVQEGTYVAPSPDQVD